MPKMALEFTGLNSDIKFVSFFSVSKILSCFTENIKKKDRKKMSVNTTK